MKHDIKRYKIYEILNIDRQYVIWKWCIKCDRKIHDIRLRLQTWYFFMHKSLKRDNKKENNEIKKIWNNKKELKLDIWKDVLYLKLSFLKNSSQQCI